ncbi:MAG TPA: serine protease [Desulfobulbus sp.]|nr:serine protease [Desulfobulbus sp.]
MHLKSKHLVLILLFLTLLLPAGAFPADNGTETPTAKVLGGTDTLPGTWPWMAALLDASESNLYYAQYCGGVLVGANWVMTAAHCVDFVNPGDIEVAVGVRDLNTYSGPRLAVSTIIVHPDFDSTWLVNDIALIELAAPATAEPVTLFSGNSRDNTPPSLQGRSTTLLGWGLYNTSGYPYFPSILQQVDLPVVSGSACASIFGIAPAASQICAGYPAGQGKDACRGDSGGPLLVRVDNHWVHAGLVSYGTDCVRQGGFYGVYTRTSSFIDFVRQHVPDLRVTTTIPAGLPWILLLMH